MSYAGFFPNREELRCGDDQRAVRMQQESMAKSDGRGDLSTRRSGVRSIAWHGEGGGADDSAERYRLGGRDFGDGR
ncbi:hypothetical protein, partial [Rhodopirellula bahusiensis]|uniref:hypothetical protein n=1 Tax=Rhodopirellula bahusiensis TaxID=2014065 RepID=UPI003264D889